ncbi:MAG: glycosyltransferase family 2 protein [Mycobacteriales bacterium]
MIAQPLISVCVSTRNRAKLLPRLVDALEAQQVGPETFEVIIFDDASTDETPETLAALRSSRKLDLIPLRGEVQQGPAAGRNHAWRSARAPIIAFTDDDCVPSPWWLSVGLRAMKDARVIGVGRVLPNPEQTDLLGPFSHTLWVDDSVVLWFATANVFYRRSDLEAVGGFDESFAHAAGEDTDLGLRVVESGARPRFLRHALVYHDVRARGLKAMLADQRRWADIPAVVARHPVLRRRGLHAGVFWQETHPRLLLLVAGLALSHRDRRFALLAWPWLHYRTCVKPLCEGPRRRWVILPAALVLELNEMRHMISGSIRHRTIVL